MFNRLQCVITHLAYLIPCTGKDRVMQDYFGKIRIKIYIYYQDYLFLLNLDYNEHFKL